MSFFWVLRTLSQATPTLYQHESFCLPDRLSRRFSRAGSVHNVFFLDLMKVCTAAVETTVRLLALRRRGIVLSSIQFLLQLDLPVLLPRQPDVILVPELFLLPQPANTCWATRCKLFLFYYPKCVLCISPVIFDLDDFLPPSTDCGRSRRGGVCVAPLVAGAVPPALAALSHLFFSLCFTNFQFFVLIFLRRFLK